MNADTLFQVANTLALVSWIILILFQRSLWVRPLIIGTSISLLASTYTYLLVTTFNAEAFESFSSLSGIMELFQNKGAVLAGWVHYLSFDLMVGLYIVSNAQKLVISRWVILPSLLLTFMMGPFGLLSYLIIRMILTKTYFQY